MGANKKRRTLVKNLSIGLVGKLVCNDAGINFTINDGKKEIPVEDSFRSMLEFFKNDVVKINLHVTTAGHWDRYEYEPVEDDEGEIEE